MINNINITITFCHEGFDHLCNDKNVFIPSSCNVWSCLYQCHHYHVLDKVPQLNEGHHHNIKKSSCIIWSCFYEGHHYHVLYESHHHKKNIISWQRFTIHNQIKRHLHIKNHPLPKPTTKPSSITSIHQPPTPPISQPHKRPQTPPIDDRWDPQRAIPRTVKRNKPASVKVFTHTPHPRTHRSGHTCVAMCVHPVVCVCILLCVHIRDACN